jgi:predicted ATPase/class 3 adenylate cyclase
MIGDAMAGTPALPTGTLTFLLTDIESSTARWDRNPDAMTQALVRHDAVAHPLIESHHGRQVEAGREGDSILAVFARASDALACAIALQSALRGERWPEGADLRVRIALHSGEAELRASHYYGAALYRANRLLATANGGQIVITGATHSLVVDSLPAGATLRDLGEHRLKDLERPERVHQVVHPSYALDERPLKSAGADRHNLLAQTTRFVGREGQLAEVKRLLGSNRLLTLTGAGGAGKTRLALEVAREVLSQYPDGVWLVELAPLSDPELIPQAVAQALGVIEEPGRPVAQTLAAWLRQKRLLLVLDSCEHLTDAVARLASDLLTACAGLQILATSRERLRVAAEVAWVVPPMAVPARTRDISPDAMLQFEAVILFTDRSLASEPGLELTEDRIRTVTEICRRLDGLPLAIELAAARVNVMSPAEILAGLRDRLRLLGSPGRSAGGRQRTLRGTLDWSYRLLEREEAALFRALSVFAGSFSLEAAEAVAGGEDPESVINILARLVDKSLVVVLLDGSGQTRYRLLGMTEEYARERLHEEQESEAAERAHALYYLRLAEVAANRYSGADGAGWLKGIDLEQDNIRSVFDRDLSRADDVEPRLVIAMRDYWDQREHVREGRSRVTAALAHPIARPEHEAGVLHTGGVLAWAQGDLDAAAEQAASAFAIRDRIGDAEGMVESHELLGQIAFSREDYNLARHHFTDALELAQSIGNPDLVGKCQFRLGFVETYAGSLESARQYLESSLKELGRAGNRRMTALILAPLGHIDVRLGRLDAARECLERGLTQLATSANARMIANFLECFAELEAEAGHPERALCLAGAAASLREATEETPPSPIQREIKQRLEEAWRQVPDRSAWERGEAMSREEAIAFALASRQTSSPVAGEDTPAR